MSGHGVRTTAIESLSPGGHIPDPILHHFDCLVIPDPHPKPSDRTDTVPRSWRLISSAFGESWRSFSSMKTPPRICDARDASTNARKCRTIVGVMDLLLFNAVPVDPPPPCLDTILLPAMERHSSCMELAVEVVSAEEVDV